MRWLARKLQMKLERYCVRKIGKWHMAVQGYGSKAVFPSNEFWFKVASRIEFRLRNYAYPEDPKLDLWTFRIQRLPKYPGGRDG